MTPIDMSGLANVNLDGWTEADNQAVLANFRGIPDDKLQQMRTALQSVAQAQEMGKEALNNIVLLSQFAKLFLLA